MASHFGGDLAATDAARVLRLPGFANRKLAFDFVGGFGIATEAVYVAPNLPSRKTGRKLKPFCENGFMPEITTF